MKSPTVIHLVTSLSVGGLERLVVEWTNARNRQYSRSTFVCCLDEPGALAQQVEGENVVCVYAKRSRFPFDFAAVARLKKMVSGSRFPVSGLENLRTPNMEIPPVVLHAHNLAAWQYGVLATMATESSLVYTQHGANVHNWGWRNRLRSVVLRWFSDRIVAVSESVAQAMTEKQGIARQKIAVIPNGVKSPDGDTTQESRDRLGVPAGAFVVGSVGRLSREKNYPLLVRAFAALRMKCPNGFLMLVGDGEDRGRIEEVAQELGVMDSCRLPGAQTDVRPWLRAMDVFCLSSDTEGMSVALLEAGALGLPAVVTDVGSNAEIVQHGVTGYVVSVGDVCAMGQVFENLHRDAGRRHQMGQAARKRIESEYSSNVTLGKYEKLYGMRWSP